MSDEKPDEQPETQTAELKGNAMTAELGSLKAWRYYSFAPEWFADALREAKDKGRGARMREILFAVCAAESYLLEWVRDTVLKHENLEKLEEYCPAYDKRGVLDKLKEIPTKLKEHGLVAGTLDCGWQDWKDFDKVVKYRHGLVHAAASRPETDGQPKKERPSPPAEVLDKMMPGWALETVRAILRRLHSDTKTTPIPNWL